MTPTANQPSLFETPAMTVSEFTRRVRRLLEDEPALKNVWVQAELSNFSRPASGHVYFTLKDSEASLRCVMWKTDAARIRGMALQDGLSVEVHGKITVYPPSGQYQLVVDLLRPSGEGALYAEFLRLKALLEAEGLFDSERKRALPPLPKTIGIVTSATGAALQDILNTLRRRLPLAEVILAPAAVQGADAPPALVTAIQRLNVVVKPDVILLARGGGSIEDLWAFNDERVVRAVAASQAPVITGVGHETDFTLVDFASDLRAPTPTAAAELATPVTSSELAGAVSDFRQRLNASLVRDVSERRMRLESLNMGLRYHSPMRSLQIESQHLDDLIRRSQRAMTQRLSMVSAHLKSASQRLDSLNPLGILRRGYAVVTDARDGRIIQSANQVATGNDLMVRLAAGSLSVRVEQINIEEAQ